MYHKTIWSSLGVNGLVSEIEEEYLDRVDIRTDVYLLRPHERTRV